MLSDFFIKRPVFATVIAAVIVLLGLISIVYLPVQQYPDIAPPKVMVMAIYNGANAETVEAAVTTPLEEEINGVEGMRYIDSNSANDGTSTITITFAHGRDVDKAVMDVKNRVDIAMGRLPQEVKATGVTVQKINQAYIMGIGFYSPDDRYDHKFISNYIERHVVERLQRIKGLGRIELFGARKYAMRLWLDPIKLSARGLSVADVVNALQSQNVEVPAGQIGELPLSHEQLYQLPILVEGRLTDESEFNRLVLRFGPQGSVIRLADVGRAELGAEDYSKSVRWLRHDASVGFGLVQLPGTNALAVADQANKMLADMKKEFPPGLTYDLAFDPTSFIKESIREVNKTLMLAILFVIAVIFLFLQNWRTTLIPTLTIPVSLIGTFFFMKAFGFSINLLTMFGIILATGIVVDDAIVVIENISRQMEEDPKLTPLQAAVKGMKEVFGAVVATALVLIAVFTPVAFFPGTTGLLYKQFALTIALSVGISAFNAITLTPALSALLLKRHDTENRTGFFGAVNRVIASVNHAYAATAERLIAFRPLVMLVFGALLIATLFMFRAVPKGFIPTEDQGYFIVAAQAPEGTSIDYMRTVVKQVEDIIMPFPEVNGVFSVSGFGFNGNAPNRAIMFVPLKPINERRHKNQSASAIIDRVRMRLLSIPQAIVIPFEPPAVQGIGNMGGFQFYLQDRAGNTPLSELSKAQMQLLMSSRAEKALTGLFATFSTDSPLLKVSIKRELATSMGIPVQNIVQDLQVLLGSAYVNDYTFENRSYRVYAQAASAYRDNPSVFDQLYVNGDHGQVAPLKTLLDIKETSGPQIISHFNLTRATEIDGAPAPGVSSGQAMDTMQRLANQLPRQFGYEWAGLYLEQSEAGSQMLLFLALGIIFVFLVLAAQYESFVDPFIIILSVPLAMLGALGAIHLRGMDNNIFTQIGIILLIGLASKNAILIVEFANQLRERGHSIVESAVTAARLRFRPIVMTSMAFIIGVTPLVFAQGAGSQARQVIGTTVFGGMIFSTLLSLFIVPVQYVLIKSLVAAFSSRKALIPEPAPVAERHSL